MVTVLFAAAYAADGFEFLKEVEGCELSFRDKTDVEGSAMRAVCTWPEADASILQTMLADLDAYETWIWPVAESEVRATGERALVYQRQEIFGLSDREVLLWATTEPVPDGKRFVWTTASDQPLTLGKGAIRSTKNEGYWEVLTTSDGGARVTHLIAVEAGGVALPGWLLRWIRTRGFARVMREVRGHAAVLKK